MASRLTATKKFSEGIFSTPAIFKATSKLFGSHCQACSDDKNWLDFFSIFESGLTAGLTVVWSSLTNHNSLLHTVTNKIASVCIDHRLRQMAFFHLRQSGQRQGKCQLLRSVEIFWNKKGFSLLYKTKLIDSMLQCIWFINRSQKTSKCGKNISGTQGVAECATFLLLPHFDAICDLLLNRCTATWNLFVK